MKRIIALMALALVCVGVSAKKEIPAGIRMEMAEYEMNDNVYSLFTYKDDDGSTAYYMSLGREYRLIEGSVNNVVNMSLSHIDETCLFMGTTSDEVFKSFDALQALLDQEIGTTLEFRCRQTTGAERLGEEIPAICTVVRRPLEGKRLCFRFVAGKRTAEADIVKSAIKSLRSGLKFYLKLHPKEK